MLIHIELKDGTELCTFISDCTPEDDDLIEIEGKQYKIRDIVWRLEAENMLTHGCSESNFKPLYKPRVTVIVRPS